MSKVDFLVKQAENIEGYDESFNRNMNGYVSALMSSEAFQKYSYKTSDGQIRNFPAIYYIGSLGIQNVWKETFYTYCRYFMLKYAEKELQTAEIVQSELLDRIFKGREMLPSIEPSRQEIAKLTLDKLSYLLAIVTSGIELTKDMLNTLNGSNQKSLDSMTDPVVQNFINNYMQRT